MEQDKKIYKYLDVEIKDIDEDQRTFTTVMTSSVQDFDNEVVVVEGVDYKEYIEKRQGLFWNHDHSFKIGEVSNIRKRGKELIAKCFLILRPKNITGDMFDYIDYIWTLVKQTKMGSSIGFRGIEAPRNPTSKDRKEFGKDVERIWQKIKVFELSLTPMPSNQDAVVTAFKSKKISSNIVRALYPTIKIPTIKETIDINMPTKEIIDINMPNKIKEKINIEIARKQGYTYY